jgi:hypothetical protein
MSIIINFTMYGFNRHAVTELLEDSQYLGKYNIFDYADRYITATQDK